MKNKIPLFKVNMPGGISVDKILNSGFIGQGKHVDDFEIQFAKHFKINENKVVSVNSCTSAIQLALELENVSMGDDVVTTPYTCLATNCDILRRGAKVVWYDIDKKTGLARLENIKEVITEKTKIVIVAHLSGCMTEDLENILLFCHQKGIKVIEDAAQSLGSKFNDKYISCNSDYVAFSFQAIKHLTTIDGGVLYCRNYNKANEGKLLRWFGFDRTSSSDFRCAQDVKKIGMKIHMTDINAFIGMESLKTIDDVIKSHIENAKIYEKLLFGISGVSIPHSVKSGSSFWVYPILVETNRDGLKEYLQEKGIHSSLVQNRLDKMSCFKQFLKPVPNLSHFIKRILHIPCGWWVREEEIKFIADTIKEYVKKNKV
jgi:perosamine synthetase